LIEISEAEKFLQGKMLPGDSLVFETKVLTDPALKTNVRAQEKVYALLHFYHRKKLREELEEIHQRLLNDPAKNEFRRRIFNLFKK
jgi:hypothetical protein